MKKLVIFIVIIFVVLIGLLGVMAYIDSKPEYPTNPTAEIVLQQGDNTGTMSFELYPNVAPQSVYNFVSLANSGYYDGMIMHRLIPDFVVQGGDPNGDGTGGPGYGIKGEFPNNGVETGLTHQKGALAWARSSDNDSAGSQFYVVLGDTVDYLDSDYAVFGYMTDGEEVLDYLNTVETDENDKPVEDITIKSVTVDTKGETYPEPDKL